MTLNEIKQSVKDGKRVCWKNPSYPVILDNKNQWLINNATMCIGLTWQDGITMNGKEKDFFIY